MSKKTNFGGNFHIFMEVASNFLGAFAYFFCERYNIFHDFTLLYYSSKKYEYHVRNR